MERKVHLKLDRVPQKQGGVRYVSEDYIDHGKVWVVYVPQSFLPRPFPELIKISLEVKND